MSYTSVDRFHARNTGRVSNGDQGASPANTVVPDSDATHAGSEAESTLRGRFGGTAVSGLFFSAINTEALQHGIRYRVYIGSLDANGASKRRPLVVGRQSDIELGIVMRSVYLEHSRNVGDTLDAVLGEVRLLNARVLDYCAPVVLREALMYRQFRHDLSSLPDPLPRGVPTTEKGLKSQELTRF
jgi:hypothetical protein